MTNLLFEQRWVNGEVGTRSKESRLEGGRGQGQVAGPDKESHFVDLILFFFFFLLGPFDNSINRLIQELAVLDGEKRKKKKKS